MRERARERGQGPSIQFRLPKEERERYTLRGRVFKRNERGWEGEGEWRERERKG